MKCAKCKYGDDVKKSTKVYCTHFSRTFPEADGFYPKKCSMYEKRANKCQDFSKRIRNLKEDQTHITRDW